MSSDFLEQVPALCPVDFFSLSCSVQRAKPSSLPDTSDFLDEERFADVALAWSEQALLITAHVNVPFSEAAFPQFTEGDSIELFIDTRDVKSSGFITRFCHHFVILPQEVQGIRAQEVTRFRTEDTHPLCDASAIDVEVDFLSSAYRLKITLPTECLHGYDPKSFNRLGFTYRINRYRGAPQHFSASSHDYAIEQHPSLWASLNLIS